MKRLFINGKVILEGGIIDDGAVLTENGYIAAVADAHSGKDAIANLINGGADEIIEADGCYISPGFIDTHIHGGAGYDVMDADPGALESIARLHMEHGCTSFLPTTLTSSKDKIKTAIINIGTLMNGEYVGARILGAHLEGPCISLKYKGAQNPDYIAEPSVGFFEELDQGLGIIRRISMAPELRGAFETSAHFAALGVNVSIAHSDADNDCVEAAARHGFSHVTHMYNGMSYISSPDFYCKTGVAESCLLSDGLSCEVIADGKHMPKEILKLIYKCKGLDKMLLTTDATRPAKMPEGNYELGGLDVTVTDGVAMLSDRTSFAGSVAACDDLVRFAYKVCGFKLHEAVRMAGLNHARLIGEDSRIGSIKVGKRADIIVFDDDINIRHVSVSNI